MNPIMWCRGVIYNAPTKSVMKINFAVGARRALPLLIPILLAACSGLAGEPRIVSTLPPENRQEAPAQSVAQVADVGHPQTPPDIALGAALYAQHCTECHGINGEGDGSLVASGQIPEPPKSFRDPLTASGQRPTEWFDTITNGRIEKLMPPWNNALTEEERWAVAMYTYTMHYSPEQITQGAALWQMHCVECHAEDGRGNPEKAAELGGDIGDLTDQADMVTLPDDALYNVVSEGIGEGMPGFAEELSEDERWAVSRFSRAISLTNTDMIGQIQQPPPPASTQEADAPLPTASAVGVVTGQISNGTAGGEVPADLTVTLHIFSGNDDQTTETNINPDGTFRFDDVSIFTGSTYFTTVTYRDLTYRSEFIQGDPATTTLELPITVYELTEDPAVITIGDIATRVNVVGDSLEIAQAIRFNNTSDRLYVSSQNEEDNSYTSVVISLPPASVIMGFDNPERYIITEDQPPTVIDTVPVFPGEQVAIVTYLIPYNGDAVIEQPLNYAAEGQLRLLIWPETVTASGEGITPMGEQPAEARTYQMYGGEIALNQGDVIRYQLSGAAAEGSANFDLQPQPAVASNNIIPLLIGGLILEVALIGGIYYFYTRRKRRLAKATDGQLSSEKQKVIDLLAQQIAELDDLHTRGQLNHDLWHRQRGQLKAKLAELMGEKTE
jgi:mono/diheme cytochrome c family protein